MPDCSIPSRSSAEAKTDRVVQVVFPSFSVSVSVSTEMWPGIPAVPTMATGATDGLYLRNAGIPTYGVSGVFFEVDDNRAHGQDERVGVMEFYRGREFLYRLTKAFAGVPESR